MTTFKKISALTFLVLLLGAGTVAITQTSLSDEANSEQPTTDDPWSEVEKVVAAYYTQGGTIYKGNVRVVDDNGEKEAVLEENSFEYTVHNNDYHYRLGDMEMVSNKDLLLAVNHMAKTVAVITKEAAAAGNQPFDLKSFRQTMLEKGAKAKVTQSGNEKILTFDEIQDPAVQGYRIYYNPSTYQIVKMELGMLRFEPLETEEGAFNPEVADKKAAAPDTETEATADTGADEGIDTYTYLIEIRYSEVRPLGLSAFVPEQKFIERINGALQLTTAFKEYTLEGAE